jgi:ribosomal protein L16 Arg81 hydroxylase
MKVNFIDTAKEISGEDFKKRYFYPQKPLVIKGLANNQVAGAKWTIDYMKKVCGDVIVDVFDTNNTNNASAFTSADYKMKFSDYIDAIVDDKPTSLRIFLFNMFKHKPHLRVEFPCPDLFKGILERVGFMFFGAKGTKVRIHQDMDYSNVILTQFYGRKKVVLVHPKYSDLLYKLPYNTHSLVDLDQPDYKKYPGLFYIETLECTLHPGDSLFIPSGYWHYITYLDGGFSVSYRKMSRNVGALLNGFLSLFVYMPYDKLMNRLFGNVWLSRKESRAAFNADMAIQRIKNEEEKVFNTKHLQRL